MRDFEQEAEDRQRKHREKLEAALAMPVRAEALKAYRRHHKDSEGRAFLTMFGAMDEIVDSFNSDDERKAVQNRLEELYKAHQYKGVRWVYDNLDRDNTAQLIRAMGDAYIATELYGKPLLAHWDSMFAFDWKGVVAHWNFDNDDERGRGLDASGNGNHAEVKFAQWKGNGGRQGQPNGEALTGVAMGPTSRDLQLGPSNNFIVSAWVWSPAEPMPCAAGEEPPCGGAVIGNRFAKDHPGWELKLTEKLRPVLVLVGKDGEKVKWSPPADPKLCPLDEVDPENCHLIGALEGWHHVAFAWHFGFPFLFIDGNPVVLDGWTGLTPNFASVQRLLVGMSSGDSEQRFTGSIDDVRIARGIFVDTEQGISFEDYIKTQIRLDLLALEDVEVPVVYDPGTDLVIDSTDVSHVYAAWRLRASELVGVFNEHEMRRLLAEAPEETIRMLLAAFGPTGVEGLPDISGKEPDRAEVIIEPGFGVVTLPVIQNVPGKAVFTLKNFGYPDVTYEVFDKHGNPKGWVDVPGAADPNDRDNPGEATFAFEEKANRPVGKHYEIAVFRNQYTLHHTERQQVIQRVIAIDVYDPDTNPEDLPPPSTGPVPEGDNPVVSAFKHLEKTVTDGALWATSHRTLVGPTEDDPQRFRPVQDWGQCSQSFPTCVLDDIAVEVSILPLKDAQDQERIVPGREQCLFTLVNHGVKAESYDVRIGGMGGLGGSIGAMPLLDPDAYPDQEKALEVTVAPLSAVRMCGIIPPQLSFTEGAPVEVRVRAITKGFAGIPRWWETEPFLYSVYSQPYHFADGDPTESTLALPANDGRYTPDEDRGECGQLGPRTGAFWEQPDYLKCRPDVHVMMTPQPDKIGAYKVVPGEYQCLFELKNLGGTSAGPYRAFVDGVPLLNKSYSSDTTSELNEDDWQTPVSLGGLDEVAQICGYIPPIKPNFNGEEKERVDVWLETPSGLPLLDLPWPGRRYSYYLKDEVHCTVGTTKKLTQAQVWINQSQGWLTVIDEACGTATMEPPDGTFKPFATKSDVVFGATYIGRFVFEAIKKSAPKLLKGKLGGVTLGTTFGVALGVMTFSVGPGSDTSQINAALSLLHLNLLRIYDYQPSPALYEFIGYLDWRKVLGRPQAEILAAPITNQYGQWIADFEQGAFYVLQANHVPNPEYPIFAPDKLLPVYRYKGSVEVAADHYNLATKSYADLSAGDLPQWITSYPQEFWRPLYHSMDHQTALAINQFRRVSDDWVIIKDLQFKKDRSLPDVDRLRGLEGLVGVWGNWQGHEEWHIFGPKESIDLFNERFGKATNNPGAPGSADIVTKGAFGEIYAHLFSQLKGLAWFEAKTEQEKIEYVVTLLINITVPGCKEKLPVGSHKKLDLGSASATQDALKAHERVASQLFSKGTFCPIGNGKQPVTPAEFDAHLEFFRSQKVYLRKGPLGLGNVAFKYLREDQDVPENRKIQISGITYHAHSVSKPHLVDDKGVPMVIREYRDYLKKWKFDKESNKTTQRLMRAGYHWTPFGYVFVEPWKEDGEYKETYIDHNGTKIGIIDGEPEAIKAVKKGV